MLASLGDNREWYIVVSGICKLKGLTPLWHCLAKVYLASADLPHAPSFGWHVIQQYCYTRMEHHAVVALGKERRAKLHQVC